MTPSKKMMYQDLVFAPMGIASGIWDISNGDYWMGAMMLAVGVPWLAIRIYHLTNQKEVFRDE